MSLLLDVVILLLVGVSIFIGIKRGFIRSIMGIVVVIAAIIGSIHFSPALSSVLHDGFIEKSVTEQVQGAIESLTSDVEAIDIHKLFEEKPQAFTDILETFDIKIEDVEAFFEQQKDNASATLEKDVAGYIAAPLAKTLSNAAAFCILFVGITVVLGVALWLLALVVKLPILNTANKLLGAAFGAVLGLVLAWGFSVGFNALLPQLSVISEVSIPETVVENTILLKYLGEVDLFNVVSKLFQPV